MSRRILNGVEMKNLSGLTTRSRMVWVAILVCFGGFSCSAIESSPDPVGGDSLLGTWVVDLRPTPDSEPYYQEFVVTSVQGNAFTGTFYGAPVSQARINTDWGTLRLAFVTADGSGPYNHSAVLSDSRLEGLSNSTGRDFLSYWTAVKREGQ